MISIVIYNDKETKSHMGFQIKGHAGYAEKGEDIVCSAVSILAINTQNSIEKFCDDEFIQDLKTDDKEDELEAVEFILKDKPSEGAKLLLDAAELGFEGIQNEYPYFVKIDYKEV